MVKLGEVEECQLRLEAIPENKENEVAERIVDVDAEAVTKCNASISSEEFLDAVMENVNDITSNENDITSNENDITSNENDITNNENDITCNEKDITSNENEITGVDLPNMENNETVIVIDNNEPDPVPSNSVSGDDINVDFDVSIFLCSCFSINNLNPFK